MTVLKVCGGILVALLFTVILKRVRPEFASLVAGACGVLLVGLAVAALSPVMSYLGDISGESSISDYTSILFKALGIGFITEITSNMCSDAGESALASHIGFFGRAEILLLSLPLLKEAVELAASVLR